MTGTPRSAEQPGVGCYDTALHDPRLCTDSRIPLDSWFQGTKATVPHYTLRPRDLRVRREPESESYVVTGVDVDKREHLIAAFSRRFQRRWQFDDPHAPLIVAFYWAGSCIATIVLSEAWRRWRSARTVGRRGNDTHQSSLGTVRNLARVALSLVVLTPVTLAVTRLVSFAVEAASRPGPFGK